MIQQISIQFHEQEHHLAVNAVLVPMEGLSKLAVCEVTLLNKPEPAYFSRLLVPPEFRKQGIATVLMTLMCKRLDARRIDLLCEINPYGEMNKEQLTTFYKKFGFVEQEHYLIRNHNQETQ